MHTQSSTLSILLQDTRTILHHLRAGHTFEPWQVASFREEYGETNATRMFLIALRYA